MSEQRHKWNDEFCSCGNDSVTCQGCGQIVCSAFVTWMQQDEQFKRQGNYCNDCRYRRGVNKEEQ